MAGTEPNSHNNDSNSDSEGNNNGHYDFNKTNNCSFAAGTIFLRGNLLQHSVEKYVGDPIIDFSNNCSSI